MKKRAEVFLNKRVSEVSDRCPSATLDVEENTKNRNWTIDKFKYGPLNPGTDSTRVKGFQMASNCKE